MRNVAHLFFYVLALGSFLACSKFVDANAGQSVRSVVSAKGEATVDFPKAGVSAAIKFDKFPPVIEEEYAFQLRFWNTKTGSAEKGPFIDPGFGLKHPDFRLYMPEHKHGSAKFKITKATEEGDVFFNVGNVVFTMEGTWEIQFKLRNAAGVVVDEAAITHVQK